MRGMVSEGSVVRSPMLFRIDDLRDLFLLVSVVLLTAASTVREGFFEGSYVRVGLELHWRAESLPTVGFGSQVVTGVGGLACLE